MPALSVFQILPPHIVCGIVNHVSGSSRMFYNGVGKGTIEYYQLQKPLLWVCHNFRAVVLSNVRRIFTMAIRQDAQLVFPVGGSTPLTIDQADSSMFHLAKALVIELDIWSLCADSRLEFLSLDIYEDGSFPLVRSVKFDFDYFDPCEVFPILPTGALSNAKALVQRILRMAPRTSEVEMATRVSFDNFSGSTSDDSSGSISDGSSDGIPNDLQAYLDDFLAQLYHCATRVTHSHGGSDIILNQEMSLVRNLVHLNFQVSACDGSSFAHLAQQCAPTLQSLSVDHFWHEEIISLIRDRNGNYVQYPQLLLLKHTVGTHLDPDELLVFSGAIPFPCLKTLIFGYSYPFGDDTPFRGNAATLEKLGLKLDHLTLETLCRHRLFTPTSHPALRYVDIYLYEDCAPRDSVTDSADLLEFSLSIGPCAPVRKIDYFSMDSDWIDLLPSFDQHQNIQVLELSGVRLTLHDSIMLIRSLPLLSDLHTSEPCLGEDLAGVDLGQLAAYFATKQLPVDLGLHLPCSITALVSGSWSRQFRLWRVVDMRLEKLVEVVNCVLLLVLLYPNFGYAEPPRNMHQPFMDALEGAINTDAFRPYATRLRRLLFTR